MDILNNGVLSRTSGEFNEMQVSVVIMCPVVYTSDEGTRVNLSLIEFNWKILEFQAVRGRLCSVTCDIWFVSNNLVDTIHSK